MTRKWSYERLTNIGGLVATIQSLAGIAFCIHFLEIFLNDDRLILPLDNGQDGENLSLNAPRIVFHHLTKNVSTLIVALLFLAGLFHAIWLGSSFYMVLGNRNGNEKSVSQFVVVYSLIGIMDIIFPFLILATTFPMFGAAIKGKIERLYDENDFSNPVIMEQKHFGLYFWLLMTFIRGGCLTFAIDTFFLVVAYKRYMELKTLSVVMHGNSGMGGPNFPTPLLDDKPVTGSGAASYNLDQEMFVQEPKKKNDQTNRYSDSEE